MGLSKTQQDTLEGAATSLPIRVSLLGCPTDCKASLLPQNTNERFKPQLCFSATWNSPAGKAWVGAGTELCRPWVQKNRLRLGPGPEWQEVKKLPITLSELFGRGRPCAKHCTSHDFDIILTTMLALFTEEEGASQVVQW